MTNSALMQPANKREALFQIQVMARKRSKKYLKVSLKELDFQIQLLSKKFKEFPIKKIEKIKKTFYHLKIKHDKRIEKAVKKNLTKARKKVHCAFKTFTDTIQRKMRRSNKKIFKLTKKKIHPHFFKEKDKIASYLNAEFKKLNSFYVKICPIPFKYHHSVSVIRPFNKMVDPFIPDLQAERMYRSAERANTQCIANLQQSQYYLNDQEVFSGFRSAALTTAKEKWRSSLYDKLPKKLANERRKIRKLLTLQVSQYLRQAENRPLLEHIRSLIRNKGSEGVRIVLDEPIYPVFLNLMSMFLWEGRMTKLEEQALKDLSGKQTFSLLIDNCRVSIQADLKMAYFNLPSSSLATQNILNTAPRSVKKLFIILLLTLLQWVLCLKTKQKKLNQTAWNTLRTSYECFCQKMDQILSQDTWTNVEKQEFSLRQAMADKIFQQLEKFEKVNRGFHSSIKNPFSIQSRIAVLQYLIGQPLHWHCKSGKDRTGVVDNEIKYLTHILHTSFELPAISLKKETAFQKAVRCLIALKAGNGLVAFENTGEFGIKNVKNGALRHIYGSRVAGIVQGDSALAK